MIRALNQEMFVMRHPALIVGFCALASLSAQAQDQSGPEFSIPALVKEMSPGVVHIASLNAAGQTTALGSGFVIDPAGTIVTAYHVIRGSAGAMIKTPDGEIYDRIEVIQYDLRRDIAVLKIQPFRPLKAMRLATDDEVVIGEDTAAIGNPQGLEATVSAGIVSGYRQAEGYRLIQTTAPVSPGSSGGPLFNMQGDVIGMVTQTVDSTRSQNLNFAVPVVYIRTLLNSAAQPAPLEEFIKKVASSPLAALRPGAPTLEEVTGWSVLHAHRNFDDVCRGTLLLRDGRLIFRSDRPGEDWDIPVSTVSDVGINAAVGRSMQAFHIEFTDGTNHNFSYVDSARTSLNPGAIVYAITAARRVR